MSYSLERADLEKILALLHTPQLDWSEVYYQQAWSESWSLEDSVVRSGQYSHEQGVGLRAISGHRTGFAHLANVHHPASLQQAVDAARSIARHGGTFEPFPKVSQGRVHRVYEDTNPIQEAVDLKAALLKQLDETARQASQYVTQVFGNLSLDYERIAVIASDGTWHTDVRPLLHLSCRVVVERANQREVGYAGGGGRFELKRLWEKVTQFAQEAVRVGLVQLDARPAPAGPMPVLLGPGWPGILLHEAVGHGLEADFNRRGSSAFAGQLGKKVASSVCTVVDDGTIFERRGSLQADDEGTPTQRTVLIENGVLTGYLYDKLNAHLMKAAPTGNGRRESYAHMPMPRMTNTFLLAGQDDPAEMLASIPKGLYAVNFGGGQVDITSGQFVFSATEAYWIENGQIQYPVKGATLVGHGPTVLQKVSKVGGDMSLDPGMGVCGKDGQQVPVGVGQPTVKVDEMIVGGTRA